MTDYGVVAMEPWSESTPAYSTAGITVVIRKPMGEMETHTIYLDDLRMDLQVFNAFVALYKHAAQKIASPLLNVVEKAEELSGG